MGIKIICENRKARHDYSILETYEAGLVLKGSEVKSLRGGKANLKDSFARILNNEAYLLNVHISHYQPASYANLDPERTRKLLLHRAEIERLMGKQKERGLSIIPLKIYFKDGKAKVELGLAKGKRMYDKREDLKRRDAEREMAKAMKSKR